MLLHPAVPRHPARRLRASIVAGLTLGLLLSVSFSGVTQAATTLNASVGAGVGTVSGNAYLPGDMTVLVGDSVKWTIESDEPHSVTFGNGPVGLPPPAWPAAGFTGTVNPPPTPTNLTGTYAGTGFLNSELLFKGSTATVTFTAAGTFPFLCQIHPGMAGTVNVVASGTTTTQAEADAKAALTRNALLGAVDAVEAAQTAEVTQTEQPDGTTLWNIFTNSAQPPAPQPGGGTGYLEIQRFVPPDLDIQAGDTVRWTALNTHTVSFAAAGQDPATIDPFTTPPTTNTTYDGTSLYHSGLLAAGPGAPTTFELTFPDAGSFPYVCALHLFNGQVGSINVSAAPVATLPPTDIGALATGVAGSEPPWLAIALVAILASLVGSATLVARRR